MIGRAAAVLRPRSAMRRAEELAQLLPVHDVLSLDVFDTAVLRLVDDPADVFTVVAREAERTAPATTGWWDFAQERLAAEARARRLARARRGQGEVGLQAIYEELAIPPGHSRDSLIELEIDVELSLSRPNPPVAFLYEEAMRLGLRVMFLSDMYLPEPVVRRILVQAGYESINHLFVSSSHGVMKATGELYDVAAQAIGSAGNRILHVGDNVHSDVRMARARGWSAAHLPPEPRPPRDELSGSIASGLQMVRRLEHERARSRRSGPWRHLGYDVAGPLYAGFTQWIARQVELADCERVFFLARDGWVLRQAYDRLDSRVPSGYLYVSRRALNLPAITELDDVALEYLTGGVYGRLSVAQYFDRAGLAASEHMALLRDHGFRAPGDLVGEQRKEALRTAFRELSDAVLESASRERVLVSDYLRQEGVASLSRVAFVDLGWHGTLQRSLLTIMDAAGWAPEVTGLYLGTFPDAVAVAAAGSDMRAYLCDFGWPALRHRRFLEGVAVWELIHTAPHGSTLGYQQEGERIVPILGTHGTDPGTTHALGEIRAAGLQFVEDLERLRSRYGCLPVSRETAVAGIDRLITSPTLQEACQLGDMTMIRGVGEIGTAERIARPPSIGRALRGLPAVKAGYATTSWRAGYARRIVRPRPLWRVANSARDVIPRLLRALT